MKSDLLVCPRCGNKLDGYTAIEGDSEPSAGNLSVCLYCQAILQFQQEGDALRFAEMTPEQFIALPLEVRTMLKQAQIVARKVIEEHSDERT